MIVYLDEKKTAWKVLAQSANAYFGITPSLQEFTKDLERKMAGMVEKRGKGEEKKRKYEDDDEAEVVETSGRYDGGNGGKRRAGAGNGRLGYMV